MKNKAIIIGSVLFACVSCTQVNSKGDKIITQDGDTVSEVDISLSKTEGLINLTEKAETEEVEKLLFKANGSEPGWFADIYSNKLRLVADYGKDSILLNGKFENLENDKGFSYVTDTIINGKKVSFTLTIKNTACVSDNGEKEDKAVSIKLNNKIYSGCGSFVK